MLSFLTKFAAVVRGVLSGFDRLFLCGTLRALSYPNALQHYLWEHRIPFKDFAAHSQEVTARLDSSLGAGKRHGLKSVAEEECIGGLPLRRGATQNAHILCVSNRGTMWEEQNSALRWHTPPPRSAWRRGHSQGCKYLKLMGL
jgi:hypothetical protein